MTSIVGQTTPVVQLGVKVSSETPLLKTVEKVQGKPPVQVIQDASALVSKLFQLGGDFVEFSGQGVERTVITKSTPKEIIIETKTVLDRAVLAQKLRALGQGTGYALKDLDQGMITVGSQIFTPRDLGTLAALARIFSGRGNGNNESVIDIKEEKPTEPQTANKEAQDKPAEQTIPKYPAATANINDLAKVIKSNVPADALKTLQVIADSLNDDQKLALIRAVFSENNPPSQQPKPTSSEEGISGSSFEQQLKTAAATVRSSLTAEGHNVAEFLGRLSPAEQEIFFKALSGGDGPKAA